jgi:hypothetical protein
MLKTIVFSSLSGMTAAAAFAMLVARAGTGDSADPHSGGLLIVPSDAAPPVQVKGSPSRPALPATARPVVETVGAAEKMFPDGLVKDFGDVPHGAQLLHRFPITNTRAEPIQIAYLKGGCDCVTAQATKRILQPGESTTIEVRLDGRRFSGAIMETVRVKVVGSEFESACKLVVYAVGKALEIREPDQVSVRTAAH